MENRDTKLPTLEEVHQLLVEVLKGTNETIKKASDILKEYTKELVSVQVLMQFLLQSTDIGIRQLAAVLLQRNIGANYLSMEPEDQKFLKQVLLEKYFTETSRPVRRSIGFLIGVLTRVTLPRGDWNELMELVSQKTNDQQTIEVRESAIILLGLILDISGEYYVNNLADFAAYFKIAIADPSAAIRRESLNCILVLLESLTDNETLGVFEGLVEPILKTMNECIDEGRDDIVQRAFGVFYSLAMVSSPFFNDKVYTALVLYMFSDRVLLNEELEISTKQSAMDLTAAIANKQKAILSKNLELLQHVVNTLCLLMLNKEKPKDMDEADSIHDVARDLIEELSMQIAKKKIYPLFQKNIDAFYDSKDPWKIEAALYILGTIAQGCCEYLKRDLGKIIEGCVIGALNSEVTQLRVAAIYTISYFTDNLCPEILRYHKLIIPALLKRVDDSDTLVVYRSLYSLERYCKSLEGEVAEYIDLLVPSFITVLDNPKSTMIMRRLCIVSISAVIESSEEKILQNIPKLAPLMGGLVKNIPVNHEMLPLRAEATSCLGKMAGLLKNDKEAYLKLIHPYVETVWTGIQETKDHELREHSFTFFYSVCHCLQEDFKPFLEPIMKLIVEAIDFDETYNRLDKGKEGAFDDDPCSDEEDPEYYRAGANVKLEAVEEKNAAIHAMGEFAKACPVLFIPYFKSCLAKLDDVYEFYQDTTREQVIACYLNLITGAVMASNGGKLPAYTCGLPVVRRFDDQIEEIIHIEFYTKVCHYLVEDDSPDVVSATLEVVTKGIKDLGPAFVDTSLERLLEAVLMLLQKQGKSQTGAEDDSDDADIHGLIFGRITDLLPALAKVLKDGFVPAYKAIHKTLKKFMRSDKSVDDISEMIGTVGQCYKYVPMLIQGYCNELLPVFLEAVDIGDDYINRNVAFTLGVFCAHSKEYMVEHYPKILQAMKYIYDNSSDPEAKDNAVATIAKMAIAQPTKVPFDQVVQTIMPIIPFKGDLIENKTAIKFIVHIIENNVQALNGFEEKAILVLIDAIVNSKKYSLKEKYVKACGLTLKALGASNEQIKKIIEASAAKLHQNEFNLLVQVMSQEVSDSSCPFQISALNNVLFFEGLSFDDWYDIDQERN